LKLPIDEFPQLTSWTALSAHSLRQHAICFPEPNLARRKVDSFLNAGLKGATLNYLSGIHSFRNLSIYPQQPLESQYAVEFPSLDVSRMHSPGYEINAMMVASPKRLEFLPQQERGRPLGAEEVVVGLRDVRNTSNGKPSIHWESDFSVPPSDQR
jgi:hypothetical protein